MTARTLEKCQQAVDMLALHGTKQAAAHAMGIPVTTLKDILRDKKVRGLKPKISPPTPEAPQIDIAASIRSVLSKRPATIADLMTATGASPDAVLAVIDHMIAGGHNIIRSGSGWELPRERQESYLAGGEVIQIVSRPDNTFLFGALGDAHIGSKYHRNDVLTKLYDRYAAAGVQCAFNTGNYLEGEAPFNRFELTANGIEGQAQLLAELYPKRNFKTYSVWGDDHEGWLGKREGINVGKYVESVMRRNGRDDWHDLGYMEAHVELVNANTGAKAVLAVVHPGGGSAYALSYRPQKIIESYEGGEKPAILLLGHYHKLDASTVRNVWYAQTACQQDQTSFMRKKPIEAHVGGLMIHCEQDPETGAIVVFTPSMFRYFNKSYYEKPVNNRWSQHGPVQKIPRTLGGL